MNPTELNEGNMGKPRPAIWEIDKPRILATETFDFRVQANIRLLAPQRWGFGIWSDAAKGLY